MFLGFALASSQALPRHQWTSVIGLGRNWNKEAGEVKLKANDHEQTPISDSLGWCKRKKRGHVVDNSQAHVISEMDISLAAQIVHDQFPRGAIHTSHCLNDEQWGCGTSYLYGFSPLVFVGTPRIIVKGRCKLHWGTETASNSVCSAALWTYLLGLFSFVK